jgi:hypothetical protein
MYMLHLCMVLMLMEFFMYLNQAVLQYFSEI